VIVGVDLGTRRLALACPTVQWCYRDDIERAAGRRDYPSEAEAGRALGARARTAIFCAVSEGVLPVLGLEFWFERPVTHSGPRQNIRSAVGQGISAGAVLAQLPGTPYEVSSTQWKKELIGAHHAKPADYQRWLQDHHPALAALCGEDEDLAAAHCIALWANLASGS
jgi:hypothetical protein